MEALFENSVICKIPDHMAVGDTIISQDRVYQVYSKTWDADNQELYCKVVLYEVEQDTIVDLLCKIYESDYFETSGFNTNQISQNPRVIVLMATITVIIGNDAMAAYGAEYKSKIMGMWNSKKIRWEEIFAEFPPIQNGDIKKISKMVSTLLSHNKIAEDIWPPFIRKACRQ